MKSALTKEDLEILRYKYVAVTFPHFFEENKTFTYFGRLTRITEDAILLFRNNGFYSYPIKDIVRINVAEDPKEL